MNIENPISRIKKAVEMSAERLADPHLDGKKPRSKHYDEVFSKFRELKNSHPEILEKLIITLSKDKELKNEMGLDLYSWFQVVWTEVNSKYAIRIQNVIKEMILDKGLNSDDSKQKFISSIYQIVNEMSKEIKIDPIIVHSFTSENEKALLDRAITCQRESIIEAFI